MRERDREREMGKNETKQKIRTVVCARTLPLIIIRRMCDRFLSRPASPAHSHWFDALTPKRSKVDSYRVMSREGEVGRRIIGGGGGGVSQIAWKWFHNF